MSISLTCDLSHFPTHSISPTHSLTKLQYRLLKLLSHFPTHSAIVTCIHLPNDHISYWRSQSLPHTHSLNYSHMHLLTKYSSTHQFVKHPNHLHTKATHPLTHTQSLYRWPVFLLRYSLPCRFKHHATRSPIHVLVQPLSYKITPHSNRQPFSKCTRKW